MSANNKNQRLAMSTNDVPGANPDRGAPRAYVRMSWDPLSCRSGSAGGAGAALTPPALTSHRLDEHISVTQGTFKRAAVAVSWGDPGRSPSHEYYSPSPSKTLRGAMSCSVWFA